MPRPKPSPANLQRRKRRASEWRCFRRDYLLSQQRLADNIGISRRTVQQIEAGIITPTVTTLRLFQTFKQRHEKQEEKFVW